MVVKEATTTMVVTRGLGDDARSAMVVIFLWQVRERESTLANEELGRGKSSWVWDDEELVMDSTGRGWSLLMVSIRACWWWERGIEIGWVIKRTLRGRESVRGRERERSRGERERESKCKIFYRNFNCKILLHKYFTFDLVDRKYFTFDGIFYWTIL